MVNYYLKIITNVLFIPFFVFCFWSLLVTKLQKYYVIFIYILHGQDRKKGKENHATKVTKIPKTKRRKYGIGMNETQIDTKEMFVLRN